MTNAVRTTATKGVPMDSMRKTALFAGVLYLITFISIPRLFLYGPVLNNPNYIVSSLSDTGVLWGVGLEMIVAIAIVGTGVALFSVLKAHNEGVALGFVAARVFEAGIIVVGIISLLSVVTLRQDLGAATGADAASLVTTGQALVAIQNWTFLIGQALMPGVNALLLGYLMYRSGLVPRVIPVLGLIGAPLIISSAIGQMFGINEQVSVWSGIAVIPIFLWELSLGVWLVVKGFKPSAKVMAAPAAEGESPGGVAAPVLATS
jgi:Domain of unknown function (DUF4386)